MLAALALALGATGCVGPTASVGVDPRPRAAWSRPSDSRHLAPDVAALAQPFGPVAIEGFEVDLGVGEPPYDDGPQPYAPERPGRAGFSDALLRASWTRRVAPGATFVTGVSALRVQDEPILDALLDLDVAWAVVGIRVSF